MNCYSVSPRGFYVFFNDFFQNYLCRFYFFHIELIENYNCGFPHKTLWIAIVFPYISLFSLFLWFLFFYDFFQNCLCCFYFFNIKLIENLVLYFFSLKHCGLLQLFPTWFFLIMIFSKLPVNSIFLILSCLRITTVYLLTKHNRLLQCFPI